MRSGGLSDDGNRILTFVELPIFHDRRMQVVLREIFWLVQADGVVGELVLVGRKGCLKWHANLIWLRDQFRRISSNFRKLVQEGAQKFRKFDVYLTMKKRKFRWLKIVFEMVQFWVMIGVSHLVAPMRSEKVLSAGNWLSRGATSRHFKVET